MLTLRHATVDDAPLLRRWDEEPHVIASDPNDDWRWETELAEDWPWRDQLIASVDDLPIGFLQIIDRHQARLRVWERGAGETQACGTGACAAAVAAIRQGWMESPVQLELPGGRLSIEWAGPGRPVIMTGPAMRVYEGQIRL